MDNHAVAPSELSFEGNMADNWSFFKQKLEIFMKATKMDGETATHKGYVLLNRIGDRALKIYNTFKFENQADKQSYNVIIRKFQDYFIPTKNITYE